MHVYSIIVVCVVIRITVSMQYVFQIIITLAERILCQEIWSNKSLSFLTISSASTSKTNQATYQQYQPCYSERYFGKMCDRAQALLCAHIRSQYYILKEPIINACDMIIPYLFSLYFMRLLESLHLWQLSSSFLNFIAFLFGFFSN